MSQKFKKGYFVKGQFVAAGSALDIQLKNELQGGAQPSRTELKNQSSELQKLGEKMLDLRAEAIHRLQLPEKLLEALVQIKHMRDFASLRRQSQYIGKLMRQLDAEVVVAIRVAVDAQSLPFKEEKKFLQQIEIWRDRLIADDLALQTWMEQYPDTDSQQLKALLRQARKDGKLQPAGDSLRHGRSYRQIYALLREKILGELSGPIQQT